MGGINKVSGQPSQQDLQRLVEETLKQNAVDVKAEVKEVVAVLQTVVGNSSLTVGAAQKTQAPGAVRNDSVMPEIEEYDAVAAALADLEKLIEDLVIDDERSQSVATQERIKSLLKKLAAAHAAVMARLAESLDKALEVAKSAKRSKIFGWIMKAIMAVALLAMTVLTVGSATPLAIAALSLAVASTLVTGADIVLDATGQKQKWAEQWADKLQEKDPELSRSKALAQANGKISLIITCIGAALSLAAAGCSIAMLFKEAGKAAAGAAMKGAFGKFCSKHSVQVAAKATSAVTSLAGTGMGIAACVYAFKDTAEAKQLSKLRAMLKEAEAFLLRIKEQLTEEEEDLKDILAMLESSLGTLSEIIGIDGDTSNRMLEKMNMSI